MKILITGARGFIGQNLSLFLKEKPDVDILSYDRSNTLDDLENFIEQADFVVHLAGVNRPQTPEEFFEGNSDLTKKIVDILNKKNKHIPMIFSSSIQAELDNDYGKSKRLAEDYILENYPEGIIYRLHNVFGKYCKPNYNSVVATFCDNIAHEKEITINDPDAKIELIYIDDICKTFIDVMFNGAQVAKPYNYIEPRKSITIGELARYLKEFKAMLPAISVPQTGDEFIKKLFSTFTSYCDMSELVSEPKMNSDERGSFTELVRTTESGQFSVSISKPGVTRGNHYHHTKVEKFIVLQGEAKIAMRKIGDDEVHTLTVSGNKVQSVLIPVGYTHNITNIGKCDMVLGIWCNENFDKNNPDTYYEEV